MNKLKICTRAVCAVAISLVFSGVAFAASDTHYNAETSGPLILKSRGSFIIGGESKKATAAQLSSIFGTPPASGGNITVNQMYVEYMVPEKQTGVPVVMLHGATLSGMTYDTTPDGRMGWYEYFVRRGYPTYVPDQVSRGRSGSDFSVYNDVRAGAVSPDKLPNVFRISDQLGWTMFRFGPSYGQAFHNEQFPVQSAAEFSRQAIPDLNAVMPTPNPNFKTMSELAQKLNGAVLMGHSESGSVPLDAAMVSMKGIKGLIMVEPGGCRADTWTEAQLKTLATVPVLAVFGDHLDANTGTKGFSWEDAYKDCDKFIGRLQKAGGNAQMLHLPDHQVYGNSHMMMMDRNNLQVADMLINWIQMNVKN
ncbi:hypothetical protein [Pantoea cypripedii]|uniref:hypothetical protein n=1 Tax=Pantoea cypripedii TaxID=55209 RepID=UPI000A0FA994|nr:hypothetical protein [Pantoea cypripedii]MBP2198789.1 pimeloyl-ACP methyl ester carboxylesterase [Pantoea cypripedii]